MSNFWLQLIGKGDAPIPEGAQVEFVLRHAPQSWKVFVFIGVGLAVLYGVGRLYRSESDDCPRAWKYVLTGLRWATLLVVLFIFLGPALVYSTERVVRPYVMLLLDDSLSMSIQDRYHDQAQSTAVARATGIAADVLENDPPSRAEIVDTLLQRDEHALIRNLARRGRVRILSFSDRIALRETFGAEAPEAAAGDEQQDDVPIPLAVGDPVPPLNPEGQATDMGRAIREAQRLAAGTPLAGIVIVSDGQNTAGTDPGAAASLAGEKNVPIFTVGVGNPADPINLRIADLWMPENVFRGDPMAIQASVEARGIDSGAAEIELFARDAGQAGMGDDPGQLITRKTVDLKSGLQTISFEHTPETPGTYIFTARIGTRPDELIATDNAQSGAVNVLGEKVRILLISGGPNWEYRLVKNLLLRDKTIDLSCWLQSMSDGMQQEGNTVIEQLPRNREELMEYDAVLMFDPDSGEFTEAWIDELKNFLDPHAGGLLWMAGPQHSLAFLTGARTQGIRDILPVQTRGLGGELIAMLNPSETREWPVRVTPEGVDHAILQLKEESGDTRALWEALPGVYWSLPVRGATPGARVLMEHTNPRLRTEQGAQPLVVAGQYGPGRTIYLGFQSTWRWRRPGVEYFQKFWIQAVRHLVEGRLARGRTRGRLLTNRDKYAAGERVSISAKLFTPEYEPLDEPFVTAQIQGPGEEPVEIELRAIPGQAGAYEATFTARHIGLNEVFIEMQKADGTPTRVARQFAVEMPNVESLDPRMNESLLKEISNRSGGSHFAIDETDALAAAIPDRQETTIVQGRPIELWDTNRALILLVVLLTAEWALRKRFRLM